MHGLHRNSKNPTPCGQFEKKVWRRGDLYKTYKIINSLGDAPQSRSIEKYYKKSGKLTADRSEVAERRVRHFAWWLKWRVVCRAQAHAKTPTNTRSDTDGENGWKLGMDRAKKALQSLGKRQGCEPGDITGRSLAGQK